MQKVISVVLLLLTLLSIGCGREEKPVTAEEAERLSTVIDSAIDHRKPRVFVDLIDEKEIARRMTLTMKSSNIEKAGAAKGVRQAIERSDIGDQIIRSVMQNGSYQLVRRYEKDNVQHLLYRLYGDGGLNYHDFELIRSGDKILIADFFIYTAGQYFTTLLTELMNFVMIDGKGNDEMAEGMKSISRIKELMMDNKIYQAKALFDKLPAELRNQKLISIMGVQLASGLDNEEYQRVLADYEKRFPNDEHTHLLLLDASILSKNYDQALSRLDKIDSAVKKDVFLEYYRALMYNLMEEPAKARTHLETLNRAMPEFGDGVLELIVNYLAAGEDEKARPLVKRYRETRTFNQEALENNLYLYPDFEE